jgi:hypothetical protein
MGALRGATPAPSTGNPVPPLLHPLQACDAEWIAIAAERSLDLAASFVINLATLRNDDRQSALFEEVIIPRATQLVEVAQTSYASGRSGYLELIQAQRTLLEARLSLAPLRVEREEALPATRLGND